MSRNAKKGRKKGGRKRQDAPPARSSPAVPGPEGDALTVTLRANVNFHEATHDLDGGLAPGEPTEAGEITYTLRDWAQLSETFRWFHKGSTKDDDALLKFSPLLSKGHRAQLHKLCEDHFPYLKAHSIGVGESRQICLAGPRAKLPAMQLSETQEEDARCLYQWMRDSGHSVSYDETRERMCSDQLTDDMRAVLDAHMPQQRAVLSLMKAIEGADAAQVRACLEQGNVKDAVRSGAPEALRGCLPLQLAACKGSMDIVKALLDAGAPIDAEDRGHKTALQVAREAEECDVEGLLLQHGATDPTKDVTPLDALADRDAADEAAPGQDAAALDTAEAPQSRNGAHLAAQTTSSPEPASDPGASARHGAAVPAQTGDASYAAIVSSARKDEPTTPSLPPQAKPVDTSAQHPAAHGRDSPVAASETQPDPDAGQQVQDANDGGVPQTGSSAQDPTDSDAASKEPPAMPKAAPSPGVDVASDKTSFRDVLQSEPRMPKPTTASDEASLERVERPSDEAPVPPQTPSPPSEAHHHHTADAQPSEAETAHAQGASNGLTNGENTEESQGASNSRKAVSIAEIEVASSQPPQDKSDWSISDSGLGWVKENLPLVLTGTAVVTAAALTIYSLTRR